MTKQEIFQLMTGIGTFHLATADNGGKPHVRGMMLYTAGEDGIVFHTGAFKDVYKQIAGNPNVELCFNDPKTGTQVRVAGVLTEITDIAKKREIMDHPSRAFLQGWRQAVGEPGIWNQFKVYALQHGKAECWDFSQNTVYPKPVVML